ncbi:hypothetical protein niasHS_013757 [Heterodera schachtii]|uniref:Uncharacterized protein n=1 Tax=Heterodera schachtii TaxID=97005 RepID=A0ABD2IM87_HETSC
MSFGFLDAAKFVQCHDAYYRENVKINEQNLISWILDQKQCINGNFLLFFKQFQAKINEWNEKLNKEKEIAVEESGQVQAAFHYKKISSYKAYQPKMKMSAISQIHQAQNVTIARYFLAKFLSTEAEHRQNISKILRELEVRKKLLDLVRYEEKMGIYDAVLKNIRYQLKEKEEFCDKCTEKDYGISYKYEDFLQSLKLIEHELSNIQITMTNEDTNNVQQYWTIEQRPIVRQTLWLVRHAERLDNISDWGNNLNELDQQDTPLSKRGIEQAKELGKRFKTEKIDKVFASPFKRTVHTASLLLDGNPNHHNTYINVEPGFGEFYKICSVKLGFMETTKLKEHFPLIDLNYLPVYNKILLHLIDSERSQRPQEEKDCSFVVENALRHILKANQNAKNIVVVSHCGLIATIHELLTGEETSCGQATVSKFVQYANDDATDDVLKRYHVEYSSDMSHLTEHSNLRPF